MAFDRFLRAGTGDETAAVETASGASASGRSMDISGDVFNDTDTSPPSAFVATDSTNHRASHGTGESRIGECRMRNSP
jgi:hypothetical protein